jgi:hypothetical protein
MDRTSKRYRASNLNTMAICLTSRALLAVLALSSGAFAQTTPAQPPPAPCPATGASQNQSASQTPPPPCAPPASDSQKPSAAEQFPFPGEPAKPAAAPDSPAPSDSKGSAADEHPFPTTPAPRLPGDDSSSSSSSSSSSDSDNPSDAAPSPKDEGTEGTSVHRKLPKPKKVQTDDERVDEDITVAKFYMNDENFAGAYLRAKDAVKVQPDYSLAHFTLAQVAQKMKKKDEAIAEFQTYLKLDPNGEKMKDAEKALAELK